MEVEDDRPIPASPAEVEALNGLIFERSRTVNTKADYTPHPPRTVSPLDAIAKLLVSRATGEATACAIQVDERRKEVVISIASSKSVRAETLDYLQGVFRQLQRVAIAQHKHDRRIRRKDGVYLGYLVRMGKQNKLTTLQKRIRSVYRTVYMFTFDNFAWQILEPLDTGFNRLEEFCSCTQEVVSTEEYGSREPLLTIRCLLRWIAANVLNHGKESLNRSRVLSLFLCGMKMMRSTFKKLAGDYDLRCELSFLSEISGFDIYEYIMKVVAISDAIQSLVDYAKFPRYSGTFFMGKTLRVNVIQTLERPFILPNSLVDWTTIAQKTVQALKMPSSNSIRLKGSYIPRRRGNNNNTEVLRRAHPTCAIVLHFLVQRIRNGVTNTFNNQNSQNHTAPFRSIGTSNEACNMCYAFFESLAPSVGVNFRVTISRKDIFPWKFPVALEEEEEEEGEGEEEEGFKGTMLTTREKRRLARMKERIAAEMFRLAARRYLLILLPEEEGGKAAGTSKRKREGVNDVQEDGERIKRGRRGD
ncbi:hypothetical protein GX50_04452 [[Emmonsia] crescens]|uniref:Uncharacterized protein n=1 Tax=[Emmonsia] crescens TaxID=73230 RepID=A0A2B7ZHT2_9EURO|nr:hypothetical protein GX50_04452 [Emmonsia crescens]